jgi:hypothetical protein
MKWFAFTHVTLEPFRLGDRHAQVLWLLGYKGYDSKEAAREHPYTVLPEDILIVAALREQAGKESLLETYQKMSGIYQEARGSHE